MPIRDGLDRRYPRIGHVSAGFQTTSKKGNIVPTRSETIVFHADRPEILEPLCDRYGGAIEESPTSTERKKRWICVSETTELPVIVPADPTHDDEELVCQNYYEAWTSAGLKRRCDGIETLLWRMDPKKGEKVGEISTESVPCICRDQGLEGDEACKPTVRLNVIPVEVWSEIPDIGVFTVRSTGINTNTELASDLELLGRMLGVLGPQVPLLLRLEQVDSRHGLVPKFRLGLAHSPRKTLELAGGDRGALSLPTREAPAELEEPVGTYVDQPSLGDGDQDPPGSPAAPTDDDDEGSSSPDDAASPEEAPVVIGPLEVYELGPSELPEENGEKPTKGQWGAVRRVTDRLELVEGGVRKAYEIRYAKAPDGRRTLDKADSAYLLDYGKWLKEQEAKRGAKA